MPDVAVYIDRCSLILSFFPSSSVAEAFLFLISYSTVHSPIIFSMADEGAREAAVDGGSLHIAESCI
ncbi:hypothetical protein I7I53_07357 [Histoplasma capsulatum var. duboisii H88]|uniref:Uncharacterized protein n=1 Tax=Ajellomyces capsulatus (strain H88) TaxID=544711 RepID=A0A8A1LGY6_AJEC8|nr:hypothetical protein I7I53_07357 [Histoplasma capsulatum var. duboisii H88]